MAGKKILLGNIDMTLLKCFVWIISEHTDMGMVWCNIIIVIGMTWHNEMKVQMHLSLELL